MAKPCWLNKSRNCIHPEYEKSGCVKECMVYFKWAWQQKKKVKRLNELGKLADKAESEYLGEPVLLYELDDEPLKWKKKRINVYTA